VSHRLRGVVNRCDLTIGLRAAAVVKDLKTCQIGFIKKLEYPRLYTVLQDTGAEQSVNLDTHVMLIVMFIMHLLSVAGLGARNVFNTACDAMTKVGYFVDGEAVLASSFMTVLLADRTVVGSLSRIAENWKTTVRRKSINLKTTLLTLLPHQEFIVPEIGYISREVHLLCVFDCLITTLICLFYLFLCVLCLHRLTNMTLSQQQVL
jgi:hypothetical protein